MNIIPPLNSQASELLTSHSQQVDARPAGDVKSAEIPRDVAAQFDSIFASLLLKEMRQTISDGGLFGGDSSDVLGSLFDLYMGQHIAQSTPLGLGNIISRYTHVQESSNAHDSAIG